MANNNVKLKIIVSIFLLLLIQTAAISWTISARLSVLSTKMEMLEQKINNIQDGMKVIQENRVEIRECQKDIDYLRLRIGVSSR